MCVRGLRVPLELWWELYPLAVTGCASLMVVGTITLQEGFLSICGRGPFLVAMSEIISLIVVVGNSPVFPDGLLVVVTMGFLSCVIGILFNFREGTLGHLSSCSGATLWGYLWEGVLYLWH